MRLYGVAIADKEHAWAVGDEGTIIASVDGGKSWKAQYPPVGGSAIGAQVRARRHGRPPCGAAPVLPEPL